ncbi:MAG: Mobile element protein [uncultured Paraburkholderia sp.]|nr:MAG: Mobile element protein [uncultured Paraburkholderia sp.]
MMMQQTLTQLRTLKLDGFADGLENPDGQFKLLHLWALKFPHPVKQDVDVI